MPELLCHKELAPKPFSPANLNRERVEFPLWLSGDEPHSSICEDTGSIPGLTQWV